MYIIIVVNVLIIIIIDIRNYNKSNENDKIYCFENTKELYKRYKKEILPEINEKELPYKSGIELILTESKILSSREGEYSSYVAEEIDNKWVSRFYDMCLDPCKEYCSKSEFLDRCHYLANDRLFPFKFSKLKNRIMEEREMMVKGYQKIDDSNPTVSQEDFDLLNRYYLRSIRDIDESLPDGPIELIFDRVF